jgi:uncharacterized protein (TIGR03437 family)
MRFALFLITIPAITAQFTTSVGDTYPYLVSAITSDSSGNTYIVGSRQLPGTSEFPNPNTAGEPNTDVFVTKLDPNGRLLFTDIFAGKGIDTGSAIALDPSGNIYIAGATTSPDFPLSNALQTETYSGGGGFIIKLTGDGTSILYSTYFGGTLGRSAISSLATDSKGNLYLTGFTQAADFPHTAGMPFGSISQSPESPGVILASISAAGDKILYAGAIVGGTPCAALADNSCIIDGFEWEGVGIGVDAAGSAYVAGNFQSLNLPTTAGVLQPNGSGAFVAKVNAGGTGLGYLTYLSATFPGNMPPFVASLSTLTGIAVDASGNAYLVGQTTDPHFPVTPGAYQTTGQGGFVAKLNPSGSAMVWGTYLNGSTPQSVAIDGAGNVWATGALPSPGFPNVNGWTTGTSFLAELNAAGSKLTYSALYPDITVGQSIAVDSSGLIHVAGSAGFISSISPSTPGMTIFAFQNAAGGNLTARISPAEVIAIYGPGIGPSTPSAATPANGFYPTQVAGVQVSINGVNIPLLFVSQNQINAVVPAEVVVNSAATVRVTNGTTVSPNYAVWIVASAPQAFMPAINQNLTVNSQSNPAHSGSYVIFYATGWQGSISPLTDGQVATGAQDACLGACQASASYFSPPICVGFCLARPAVSISLTATATYGGAAPGMVAGITQFNVRLGSLTSSSGAYPFTVSVSGGPSNATVNQTVWIAP